MIKLVHHSPADTYAMRGLHKGVPHKGQKNKIIRYLQKGATARSHVPRGPASLCQNGCIPRKNSQGNIPIKRDKQTDSHP